MMSAVRANMERISRRVELIPISCNQVKKIRIRMFSVSTMKLISMYSQCTRAYRGQDKNMEMVAE